jgi:hypothetical protein
VDIVIRKHGVTAVCPPLYATGGDLHENCTADLEPKTIVDEFLAEVVRDAPPLSGAQPGSPVSELRTGGSRRDPSEEPTPRVWEAAWLSWFMVGYGYAIMTVAS